MWLLQFVSACLLSIYSLYSLFNIVNLIMYLCSLKPVSGFPLLSTSRPKIFTWTMSHCSISLFTRPTSFHFSGALWNLVTLDFIQFWTSHSRDCQQNGHVIGNATSTHSHSPKSVFLTSFRSPINTISLHL